MTIKQLFATAPVTTVLLISFIGLFLIQLLISLLIRSIALVTSLKWWK